MHEMGITRSILESVKSECLKQNIIPKRIVLELGKFAGHDKEEILLCYSIIKSEYPLLKSAEFVIQEVPTRIKCKLCGKKSILLDAHGIVCPLCQSTNIIITGGKSIKIRQIEGKRIKS